MPRSRQNYISRSSLTLVDQERPEVAQTWTLVAENSNNFWFQINILSPMTMVLQWNNSRDVLILAAKNLNKFRFQTNIWSAMTMVRVKCSEHNYHIARFSAEQVVIKWRRRYYWSRVRRGKRSIICTRKIYLIYSFWKSVSWSFFQQRKRPGSIKLLPSTEAVWCHYNFFQ